MSHIQTYSDAIDKTELTMMIANSPFYFNFTVIMA